MAKKKKKRNTKGGSLKRAAVVCLIPCLAVGAGIALNHLWRMWDAHTHPKDYVDYVEQYAEEYDVPADVIWAVIKVESDFDPLAESSVGARGLMQMMPATFDWLTGKEHLGEHLPDTALYTPEVSIRYGAYYLRYLHQKFDNWETVFAAYNGGEGNVAKWLADPQYSDGQGNLTYIPFEETRNYVTKVKNARQAYRELYGEEASQADPNETNADSATK